MLNTMEITERIEEMKLSQTKIAKNMGIAASTLNLKLHNKRPMYLNEANLLADILKIETKDLRKYFFAQ